MVLEIMRSGIAFTSLTLGIIWVEEPTTSGWSNFVGCMEINDAWFDVFLIHSAATYITLIVCTVYVVQLEQTN